MADPVPTPIVVKDNATIEMLATAGRQLVLIFGGAAALIALLKAHDLVGVVNYVRSSDFVQVLAAASTLASLAYGQWKTWQRKQQLLTTAEAAPDNVATVQKKES